VVGLALLAESLYCSRGFKYSGAHFIGRKSIPLSEKGIDNRLSLQLESLTHMGWGFQKAF